MRNSARINPVTTYKGAVNNLLAAFCVCICIFAAGCRSSAKYLRTGNSYEANLFAGGEYQAILALKKGELACLEILAAQIQLQGEVIAPDNSIVSKFYSQDIRPTPFSVLALGDGNYRLKIKVAENTGKNGSLKVSYLEVRPATYQDSTRLKAENIYAEAEFLQSQGEKTASERALSNYEKARQYWEEVNDKERATQALRKIGDVYAQVGDLLAAKKHYLLAQKNSLASQDSNGAHQALLGIAEVNLKLDDHESALPQAQAAWEYSSQQKDQTLIAQALSALGECKSYQNTDSALALLNESLQYWRQSGATKQQSQLYYKISQAYFYNGQFHLAATAINNAWDLAVQHSHASEETAALNMLGLIHSVIGEKQKALDFYQKSQAKAYKMGDRVTEAFVTSGMAFVYEELGEYQNALPLRKKCLDIYSSLAAPFATAYANIYVGELLMNLQQEGKASHYFQQVAVESKNLRDPLLKSFLARDNGLILEHEKRFAAAYANYQRAWELGMQGLDERRKSYLLADLGRVQVALGNYQQAETYYEQALQQNERVADQMGASQNLYQLAVINAKQKKRSRALNYLEQSKRRIESLRSFVLNERLRTSYFASVHKIFELSIQLLMDVNTASPTDTARALALCEQSHARGFLDSLQEAKVGIFSQLEPQFKEQKKSLVELLHAKTEERTALLNGKHEQAAVDAVNEKISETTEALRALEDALKRTHPRYSELTDPQPLRAEQIQQLLTPDALLLEFALGEQRSYVWAVTPDQILAFALPARRTIEARVRTLCDLLRVREAKVGENAAAHIQRIKKADGEYRQVAAELSQLLLQPLASLLGKKRLVIVGDGALHYLPFGALPEPVRQSERRTNSFPLLVNHEITMLPSASVLQMLRENPDEASLLDSIAVLADPVFNAYDERVLAAQGLLSTNLLVPNLAQIRSVDIADDKVWLDRLYQTRKEADAIRQYVAPEKYLAKTDFAVNRSVFESDELIPYKILHIATHGYVDTETPEASGIVLSRYDVQGKKVKSGILYLADIYALKLPKELVVLSACETAWGKEIKGEGLIALSRGFFYAGAQRVLASLWKVEENATRHLMTEFYRQLLQEKQSPAAALRAAQIAMWKKNPHVVPYDWAAFVLQGEYR